MVSKTAKEVRGEGELKRNQLGHPFIDRGAKGAWMVHWSPIRWSGSKPMTNSINLGYESIMHVTCMYHAKIDV